MGSKSFSLIPNKVTNIDKSVEINICDADEEGHPTDEIVASGRLRINYKGQPYFCRNCQVKHVFCEKSKKERERIEKVKAERAPLVNQVILGT